MDKRLVYNRLSGSGTFQEPSAPLSAAMADVLDYLPIGVIQVDIADDVVLMNASAKKILAEPDGLTLRDCRLIAATKNETVALRKLVAAAVQSKTGASRANSLGAIALSRRHPLQPQPVIVMALRRRRREVHEPIATIFVGDPDCPIGQVGELLMRLYGLTAAEARLAADLLEGKGLAVAAAKNDVKVNTARTHLQQIFRKTRTNRQVELVKSTCHILEIGARCTFGAPVRRWRKMAISRSPAAPSPIAQARRTD